MTSEVNFYGLTKTKPSFLNNILKSKPFQTSSIESIEADLQILKNLPSIANAQYQIDTIENEIIINYKIEERRTALPILNFGGIRNNIWFSVGVIENNFRGQGDLALAYYQNNNGRHSGELYYKKPRLLDSEWGYSVNVRKWASDEPVYFDEGTVEYLYNNNGIGGTLIRNFGLNYKIEFGGTYFVESYAKNEDPFFGESPGPDNFSINKGLAKIEFTQNHLNYNYFYLKGFETLITYHSVFSFGVNDIFNSFQIQNRLFLRPSKKLNLAFRLKLGISTNNDSPFAPFVADSHFNLRGIGNRIDRGTAQAVLNFEGRYTVYHVNHFSIQLVGFADSGTWRNPGGQLGDIFNSDQFRQFIGGGLRINYQKVFGATLRIDYGVDIVDKNQRGFVIGLGQYF